MESFCFLLFLTIFYSACTPLSMDDNKAVNYALGQQYGKNLIKQGTDFELDYAVLELALNDVANDKPSRLNEEQLSMALQKAHLAMNKRKQDLAQAALIDGKKFLESNKTKSGVKTTASGLQYIVLNEGTGKNPSANDIVKIHYVGTLINGRKFDSSYDRKQALEIKVSKSMEGWSEGLQLMKVGDKMKFFIPSELGFGVENRPYTPGNSVLIYEIELLDILTQVHAIKAKK